MPALLQFHHPGATPELSDVLAGFGLDRDDVDIEFGVVATDPQDGLFTVRVEDHGVDKARAALALRPAHPAEGLFGDPRIEPLGPGGAA